MSTKPNSTIRAKPQINPAIENWIGAPVEETPAPAQPAPKSKPASLQAVKPASQIASQPAIEATSMLSCRIPASLMRQLRIRAVSENRQIQDIVAELLRGYLGEE